MTPLSSQSGVKHNNTRVDLLPFELTTLSGYRTSQLHTTILLINKRARVASFCPGLLIWSTLSPQEPF